MCGIRILTYDQDIGSVPPDPVADVVLTWNDAQAAPEYRVPVLKEAVRPVCSSAYAATHADILNGSVEGWGALTFIDCARPNDGWATWDDWFAVAGRPKRQPSYLGIESYPYVLEAAAAGRGLALGWRGYIEPTPGRGHPGRVGRGIRRIRPRLLLRSHREGTGKGGGARVPGVLRAQPPAVSRPAVLGAS